MNTATATTTTTNIAPLLISYQKEDSPVVIDLTNRISYQKEDPPPSQEIVEKEDGYYIVFRRIRPSVRLFQFFDECLAPIMILMVVSWLVMSFVVFLIRH